MDRIFIAQRALNKLKHLLHENAGITSFQGIPVYVHHNYPMFRKNGDIVWGVIVLNTGYRVPLVEEVYQVTTA